MAETVTHEVQVQVSSSYVGVLDNAIMLSLWQAGCLEKCHLEVSWIGHWAILRRVLHVVYGYLSQYNGIKYGQSRCVSKKKTYLVGSVISSLCTIERYGGPIERKSGGCARCKGESERRRWVPNGKEKNLENARTEKERMEKRWTNWSRSVSLELLPACQFDVYVIRGELSSIVVVSSGICECYIVELSKGQLRKEGRRYFRECRCDISGAGIQRSAPKKCVRTYMFYSVSTCEFGRVRTYDEQGGFLSRWNWVNTHSIEKNARQKGQNTYCYQKI